MTGANRQLDITIDAFAVQSNVTAAHADQLRRALAADDLLLKSMNEAAKQGHLRAFALDSSQDGPIGRTDIASGTMRLPPTAFATDTGATAASLKTALTLQEMSLRFGNSEYLNSEGQRVPVSQEMVGNLQQALGASPALLHQAALAISAKPEPHLKSFSSLPDGQGMGAAYDGDAKAVSIPANRLQARSQANPQGFDEVAMIYTLAHETQHAFNHQRKQLAWREFHAEVRQIARDDNPVNDYTRPVAKILQASRTDEAEGEIAGWNAVLSMKQKADPLAGLEEMRRTPGSRAYLFVTEDSRSGALVGKSGLTFNGDASVTPSPQNIEAMGRNYFDRDSRRDRPDSAELVGLGPNKESNYPNYYARNAIEQLITIDRRNARSVGGVEPQMHLEMKALGLEERLIERLGLQINPRPLERQAYYDTSQSLPVLKHFDHTKSGPSLNQHVPIDPAILTYEPIALARERPTPAQQGHPDNGLYSQIAAQVRQQDQQHGRQWDEASERMTASLLILAKENGLSRVDHVVFNAQADRVGAGENVFIVQGRLDDPAHVRAHMKTEDAVRTPESVSFAKVDALNERRAGQAIELQPSHSLQDETQRGPHVGR